MAEKLNTHQEMLKKLIPFVNSLKDSGFSYLILVGKDETCARYLDGNSEDVEGMLEGLAIVNPSFNECLKNAINK